MGRGTRPKVQDGSGDPWRGQGQVGGLSWRFRTGQGTLLEVRDELVVPQVFRDASGDPPGGSGQVG